MPKRPSPPTTPNGLSIKLLWALLSGSCAIIMLLAGAGIAIVASMQREITNHGEKLVRLETQMGTVLKSQDNVIQRLSELHADRTR